MENARAGPARGEDFGPWVLPMDGLPSGDVREHDPSEARSGDAGTEEMHCDAANATSDMTSDGEEEIAGLVHAKERAQTDTDEGAHAE
jgi:hypothetical protein